MFVNCLLLVVYCYVVLVVVFAVDCLAFLCGFCDVAIADLFVELLVCVYLLVLIWFI